ncbi:MAG: ABC transporter substrate-binding protein [Catonella sp.]|uniref:ABC transporter substrate-binding protein n=1 Tax=Catonella sp. TaxID=2382125 RepID=UPI003FA0273C
MKLKKVTSLALAAVMAASLVGCSKPAEKPASTPEKKSSVTGTQASSAVSVASNTASAPVETTGDKTAITLWTYPVGKWGDSATVDEMLSKFNAKYPDISVSVEYLDYTNGDDQINTAIEGGQAPDIVLEGPERLVANWGAKGLMVDLSDLYTDASKDFYENVTAACKSPDGKFYEYPLCMVAHCMAINKKVFEEADAMKYLDAEKHTWTTENFLKAVKAVNDKGQENVLAVYCSGQGGDQGTRALINNMYGGTFTNPDHTQYTIDDAKNVKALETLKNTKGVNFDASIAGGDEIKLFRDGTFAMSLCWNASQQNNTDNGEAGKTNDGSEIFPMQFPSEDGNAKLCGGIWGFGIFDNKDEAKIKAAKTFVDFMANDPEQVKESVKSSGFFPVHSQLTDVYAGTEIADTMDMFTKNFMPSMGDYYQVTKGWPETRTAWWNMLQKVGTGEDIQTVAAECSKEANAAAAAAK